MRRISASTVEPFVGQNASSARARRTSPHSMATRATLEQAPYSGQPIESVLTAHAAVVRTSVGSDADPGLPTLGAVALKDPSVPPKIRFDLSVQRIGGGVALRCMLSALRSWSADRRH